MRTSMEALTYRKMIRILLLLLNIVPAIQGFLEECVREPLGIRVPNIPSDGGFHIEISGNPDKYIPGELYIVSLKGKKTHFRSQKFTSFYLVAETSHKSPYFTLQSVGIFMTYKDSQVMHSDTCPNTIQEVSKIQKNDIQVGWTAPPTGSGCIKFKATVVDTSGKWYMDDGQLTKELCEDVQQAGELTSQVISDCCACNEAKYEVTFEGIWSRQTHPKDFPENEWLTHFSDIIGASHSADYRIWAPGQLASDGLRQVAEWGSTRTLESELKRESDHIRTIIKARGLWHPNVNGKTFAVFRVDNRHHLMSLVSMLGPSPDWIVGVSSLELCLKNCSWADEKIINLYPWDAGTDSGVTYLSENVPTIPRGKIRRITNAFPNDKKSPFFDEKGLPMKPLGRLTITKQRVYEKSCGSDIVDYEPEYITEEETDRPECSTGEWTEWTPCSRTCENGIRERRREYRIPIKADMFQCNRQLTEREMCIGDHPYCANENGNNHGGHFPQSLCETTPWTSWTPCSQTCGEGVSMRTRRYMNRMGKKRCGEPLTEKRSCLGDVPQCDEAEEQHIDPQCSPTQWTNWSPCSVTCGTGIRVRKRYFLIPSADEHQCGVRLSDKQMCYGERENCDVDRDEARRICKQPKIKGPCGGEYTRWYYDSSKRMCLQFMYGGCRGNQNNFQRYDDCTKLCEFSRDDLHTEESITNNEEHFNFNTAFTNSPGDLYDSSSLNDKKDWIYGKNTLVTENQVKAKVDCVVSEWSDWGTIEDGWSISKRVVKVGPQNGGKRCPRKMIKRRKCKSKECKLQRKRHNLQSMSLVFDPYRDYVSPIMPSSDRLNKIIRSSKGEDTSQMLADVNIKEEEENMDCVLGDWSPWSPCTHSCGRESLQQRVRSIIVRPRGKGASCGPTIERKYCSLPPCNFSHDI